jgi:uncharacterized Zn-binding protein involved in type VI secretion
MPAAATVGDTTTHGGTIVGPGCSTVLINNKPAAVFGDNHVCSIPPNTGHPTSTPFIQGSTTVMIGGKFALRMGDTCVCGASSAVGQPTVMIG